MMKYKKTFFAVAIAIAGSAAITISPELRELILEILQIVQGAAVE